MSKRGRHAQFLDFVEYDMRANAHTGGGEWHPSRRSCQVAVGAGSLTSRAGRGLSEGNGDRKTPAGNRKITRANGHSKIRVMRAVRSVFLRHCLEWSTFRRPA